MSNIGHGHVNPRDDGLKARCGGPAICPYCARDLAELRRDHVSTTCGDPTICPHCALEFARNFAGVTKVLLAPILQPGDTLVVGISSTISREELTHGSDMIGRMIPDVKVVLLSEVEAMAVIRREDAVDSGSEGDGM